MEIRQARPDDAASLAELYELVWSQEIEILGERLACERRADEAKVLRWIEEDTYYISEENDEFVAVLGCEERHGTLHLVHLVTHLDHRRKGYAEALMRHAESLAVELGVSKIWFDTAPGLEASNRLYEKLGYTNCGYLKNHYWGTDIILYEKLL
jgi:ribosomal protein S18 acetylase RimI-like enzyme